MKNTEEFKKICEFLDKIKAPTVQYIFISDEEYKTEYGWLAGLLTGSLGFVIAEGQPKDAKNITIYGYTFHFLDPNKLPKI